MIDFNRLGKLSFLLQLLHLIVTVHLLLRLLGNDVSDFKMGWSYGFLLCGAGCYLLTESILPQRGNKIQQIWS
jgi:hypothetical protein